MRACATTLEPEMTPAELQLLNGVLSGASARGQHLEVGTAAGGTLVQMMKAFPDADRPQFVVVDRMTYFPDQAEIVKRNLIDNDLDPDSVDMRRSSSGAAFTAAEACGESFDFILIDASHKIISVMADLRWARLLNPGGVMCFHDYTPKFPGVQMAVDRFLKRYANYEIIGQADSLLAIRKSASSNGPEIGLSDRVYSFAWHVPLDMQRRRNKRAKQAA